MDLSTDKAVFEAVGKSWRCAMLIKLLRAEGPRTAMQLSQRLTELVAAEGKKEGHYSTHYQGVINDLGQMWRDHERGDLDLGLRRDVTCTENLHMSGHPTPPVRGSYLWKCGNGKRWLMPHAGNVLALRHEGLTNNEIADRLGLNYARVSELANDPFGDRARERNRKHERLKKAKALQPDKAVLAFVAGLEREGYKITLRVNEESLLREAEVEFGGHRLGACGSEDWWEVLAYMGLER